MWEASIFLYPSKGVPPKPLNVSLYLYKDRTLTELPLLQISKEGVRVLAPPVKYRKVSSTVSPTTVLEIEANWGYRGFFFELTPTNTTIIQVLTGNITPCAGQCFPREDKATFYEYYYYVNGSGSFLISSYPFVSSLYSIPEIPEDVKKPTQVVYGKVNGSFLIFSNGDRIYKIPLSNITPYLWDNSMSAHMVGYFLHGGIAFFPEIKVSAFELPSGYKYVKRGEGLVIKISGAYSLAFYNRSRDEYGTPCWDRFKTIQLSEHDLKGLLKKPVYVFFYNGKKLKVFPIMRVRMELNVRENHHKVEVRTLYTFQNIAEKLKPGNNRTSTPYPAKKICGTGILSLLPLALAMKRK